MDFSQFTENIKTFLQSSPGITYQLILTLSVFAGLWLVRFLAIRLVNHNLKDTRLQYKWRKNLTYIFAVIGAFLIGRIWFEGLASLATFLGLLSAGLAIALRDPVTDIAGWLFIIWRTPFDIGDRIQIDDVKGDVIDQRLFKFTVLEIGNWVHADQSTGRVIHMPNHKIFNSSIANYTSDFEFIWNEIPVLVTFESNWEKAKEILQRVADKHLQDYTQQAERMVRRAAKSYLIQYQYLTPIVYTEVADSGVKLTIRHLTDPRKRRSLLQSMWEDILDEFAQHDDIDLAYPTYRIFRNPEEGKPGTGRGER